MSPPTAGRSRGTTSGRPGPVILFVLAPGAGAGSDSPWMKGWRDRLATLGSVETLDYPYRLAGRKAPDKLPVLIEAHRRALIEARARHPQATATVLVGKSMGGRVGCHLALEERERIEKLVCLGYPLRGQSGALRDEVLLSLQTPILFVQGTRDPLCPLDALAAVRSRMSAPNHLLIVERGNHSLEVPRGPASRGRTALPRSAAEPRPSPALDVQALSDARVLDSIASFVRKAEHGTDD